MMLDLLINIQLMCGYSSVYFFSILLYFSLNQIFENVAIDVIYAGNDEGLC